MEDESFFGAETCIRDLLFSGTILFTFETPGATSVVLSSVGDVDGYLQLQQTDTEDYQIILSQSLDLNLLNPQPEPVSITTILHYWGEYL